ncbi:MAG TPA: class I SAM-dependent methyltransferase [Anaerolineae bacterium]|nr:class I SAM-dependent methyltransferase [Anaerolineae bacterium]
MPAAHELMTETRKADVNLHRFISDERWRHIHDAAAPDYKSGEWVRENVFGVGRMRRDLFALAAGSVLDVGCGYGGNFKYLTNATRITGVDVSSVMLEMARAQTHRLDLEVDLREGDVEHLDFPDHTFDAVISALATCSYLNPIAALREMKRVCKPDGRLLLLEHGRSSWELIGHFQDRAVAGSIQRGGCRVNQEPQQIIQAAGLKITSAHRSLIGIFHVIQVSPG